MNKLRHLFDILLVFIVGGMILGAFTFQFVTGDAPCPLCELQRLGLIGVAVGALLNIRFGYNPKHDAVSIFSAMMGGSVSLRQVALHVCPGFPTFSQPLFGLELWTWAFIAFAATIFGKAVMMFLVQFGDPAIESPFLGVLGKIAFWFIAVICLANIVDTFMLCGFGPCAG